MLTTLRADVPMLVRVTFWAALVVPTCWSAKVSDDDENEVVPLVATPATPSVCGLVASESVTDMFARRVPPTVGAKVTDTVQLWPTARLVGQVLVTGKSDRLLEIEVIESEVLPWFFRVAIWLVLEPPRATLPKLSVDGVIMTPGTVALPVNGIVCGLPPALSVIFTVPAATPETVGEKMTLMVQLAPGATEVPQS